MTNLPGVIDRTVTAEAHGVQGILCAHGYIDPSLRILPVPTVFAALQRLILTATVTVRARPALDGSLELASALDSSSPVIDVFASTMLKRLGFSGDVDVTVSQNFPMGIGLGSSAALFAAVAKGIAEIVAPQLDERELSALARLGSYSAAAALVGNVAVVHSGDGHPDSYAEVLCQAGSFEHVVLILPVLGEKYTREIHEDIVKSPFYDAWRRFATPFSQDLIASLAGNSLDPVSKAVEDHMYASLATIITGPRHLMPWVPETLARLDYLRRLRESTGDNFIITMNTGPALFVYAKPDSTQRLADALTERGYDYLLSSIGGPARIVSLPIE